MQMRIALAMLSLVLAGCRYESTADLRPSASVYSVTGAYPEGEYLFQTAEQDTILALVVGPDKAALGYQLQGWPPMAATIIAVLGSNSFPDRTYVAMAPAEASAGSESEGFQYFPFSFGSTHVEWVQPPNPTKVSDIEDLARHLAAPETKRVSFALVAERDRPAVLARFEAWRGQGSAGAPSAPAAPAPAAPVPVAPPAYTGPPTVRGLAVGDGVHVQGILSDSPSIIQEIDQANGRVKVRRMSDGVSEWVSADRLISRDESTMNDLARTGAVLGVFVCLLSPETCQDNR